MAYAPSQPSTCDLKEEGVESWTTAGGEGVPQADGGREEAVEVGICSRLGNMEPRGVASTGAGGCGESTGFKVHVGDAIDDFVHRHSLLHSSSLFQGGEFETGEDSCSARGLAEVASDASGRSSLNFLEGIGEVLLVGVPHWRCIFQCGSDQGLKAGSVGGMRAATDVAIHKGTCPVGLGSDGVHVVPPVEVF